MTENHIEESMSLHPVEAHPAEKSDRDPSMNVSASEACSSLEPSEETDNEDSALSEDGEVPSENTFEALNLLPEIQKAVEAMGFTEPTDIQRQAIPLLRSGADIIGRSQTGTGKTMAFAIPAVEMIDRTEAEPTVQVLILCPTRELAQQGCEEIKKLIRFMLNIWPVDVYGGAAMDRQLYRLKRANLVIGTPGRIMDHMRRGSLDLSNVKLVVLDEADEMLSMGFREDIETILQDVPETRQTVLFSATMPDAIMELTDRFMKDPQLVEINKAQVTLEQIHQMMMEVPMGRKLDALNLLLHAYEPTRCMIFCNTKLMVDEVSAFLNRSGFGCEGIHGDMNQSQRTRVMEGFKSARIPILVATDVAARGIDVNDIDYVINYDLPQNSEIYVHRIGRTGRAGKEGSAITLCSGRRQFFAIRDIGRVIRSSIDEIPIPTVAEIRERQNDKSLEKVRAALGSEIPMEFQTMVGKLMAEGHEPAMIASAAMQLCFARDESALADVTFDRKSDGGRLYRKLLLGIGRRQKVAPNHIVSAIAGRANIRGAEIGKIEIYDERSVVGVPAEQAEAIERAMQGASICGVPVTVKLSAEKPAARPAPGARDGRRAPFGANRRDRTGFVRGGQVRARFHNDDGASRGSADYPDAEHRRHAVHVDSEHTPQRRGKVKLSSSARARLLDGADLERFEIKPADDGHKSRRDYSPRRHEGRPNDRRGSRKNSDRGSKRRDRR
ncbi:MAG: DEAD/DEAH box helicase [Clostridia bacterium]|nr:DEAD/DEAH box helicase [Clostridia bacterium]